MESARRKTKPMSNARWSDRFVFRVKKLSSRRMFLQPITFRCVLIYRTSCARPHVEMEKLSQSIAPSSTGTMSRNWLNRLQAITSVDDVNSRVQTRLLTTIIYSSYNEGEKRSMKLFFRRTYFHDKRVCGTFPPTFIPHVFSLWWFIFALFFGEPRECFFADTKKKWTAIN